MENKPSVGEMGFIVQTHVNNYPQIDMSQLLCTLSRVLASWRLYAYF